MFRPFDRALALTAVVGAVLVCDPSFTVSAQAPALPTGREVVARHLEAMGGEAAFRAVTSMRARGTLSLTAQQIGGEV